MGWLSPVSETVLMELMGWLSPICRNALLVGCVQCL